MLSVLQESFWERLSGVIGLKRPVYEAIQRDPEATSQSWWIVVLLGLANGIAWIVTPIVAVFPSMTDEMARDVAAAGRRVHIRHDGASDHGAGRCHSPHHPELVPVVMVAAGDRKPGGRQPGRKVTSAEMRRLVGWGYSPTLASFLTPIPVLGPLLATLGAFWTFVTGVMAVRTAFGVGIWKAIGIELAAFLVMLVVVTVVVLITVMIAWPLA